MTVGSGRVRSHLYSEEGQRRGGWRRKWAGLLFFLFWDKCSEKRFICKNVCMSCICQLAIGFYKRQKYTQHVSLLLMLHSFPYTCHVMYGMNWRFFSSGSKSHRCTRNESSSAVPSMSSSCGTTSTSTSTSSLLPTSSLLWHAVAVAHAAVAVPVTLSFTFFCFGMLGLPPPTTLVVLLLLPPPLSVPMLVLLFLPLSISTCSIMSASASTPTAVTRPRCRCFWCRSRSIRSRT